MGAVVSGAPSAAATAPLPVAHEVPARRRTGTPRVGVPVRSDADDAETDEEAQAPVAGTIENQAPRARRASASASGSAAASSQAAPRTRRATQDPNATSQVWFEDGERTFDAPDDAPAPRPRKILSPSTADLDDEEPPRKSRFGLYAALGAVLLAGGGLALALGGGGGSERPAAPTAPVPIAAAAPVDAAPSIVIETPDAVVAAVPVDAAAVAVVQPAVPTRPTELGIGTPPPHPPTPTDHGHVPSVDDDPSGRRPTGLGPVAPPLLTPPPGKGSGAHGISGADGPVDPYGSTDAPPDASGDKKAEFDANLGAQQLASGDTAAAAASYKRAAELDPKNVTAVTGLGEIALRQGLFGDAIAHLNKAAKLAPRSSRVFTLLGEAYMNAGQSAQAVANFKKALQLDPDNARAREGFNEASSRVPPPTDDN
jgi:hypothetical protein